MSGHSVLQDLSRLINEVLVEIKRTEQTVRSQADRRARKPTLTSDLAPPRRSARE